MIVNRKLRKSLVWAFLALLIAGLVYAGVELMGQANKNAADAGSTGADMEMASLDTIKQSQTSKVNWNEERSLRKKIDQADSSYRAQVEKARSDIASTGKVSDGTRAAGLASAEKFRQANDTYAAFWDKNNGKSRAKLAREAGLARVKNADMTFNDVNSDKIKAYNEQQDALTKARKDYLAEAKNDVSASDRTDIKRTLTPRLNKMTGDVNNLVSSITSLLDQVKSQAGGMGVGAIGGCAKQAATSGPSNGASALLSPLMGLLNMVKGLGSNVNGLMSDLSSL